MRTTITKQAGAVQPLPPKLEDHGHTPGPWQYQPEPDSRSDGYIRTVAEAIQPGATNMRAVARACHSGIGVYEMRANARLIASAPELLSALKQLLRETWDADRIYGDEHGESMCSTATWTKARAAIERATRP